MRAERVAIGIFRETLSFPCFVIGAVDELFETGVERSEPGGDELSVHDRARRGPAFVAPTIAIRIGRIVALGIVPNAGIDHVHRAFADVFVSRIDLVEELRDVVPDRDHLLRVVEEFLQAHVELVKRLERNRGADTAGHDRLRVRIFAA